MCAKIQENEIGFHVFFLRDSEDQDLFYDLNYC